MLLVFACMLFGFMGEVFAIGDQVMILGKKLTPILNNKNLTKQKIIIIAIFET